MTMFEKRRIKYIDCKIAIIGHGFVGKAVDYGFSNPKENLSGKSILTLRV